MTASTINCHSDWDYELKISITKKGMTWALYPFRNNTIYLLSSSSSAKDKFIIDDLAIRNGKNGQSIFATNYPANIDSAEEFSLVTVVNNDLSLGSWFKHVLYKGRCRLEICYTE